MEDCYVEGIGDLQGISVEAKGRSARWQHRDRDVMPAHWLTPPDSECFYYGLLGGNPGCIVNPWPAPAGTICYFLWTEPSLSKAVAIPLTERAYPFRGNNIDSCPNYHGPAGALSIVLSGMGMQADRSLTRKEAP